jgi:hypothetical protein
MGPTLMHPSSTQHPLWTVTDNGTGFCTDGLHRAFTGGLLVVLKPITGGN